MITASNPNIGAIPKTRILPRIPKCFRRKLRVWFIASSILSRSVKFWISGTHSASWIVSTRPPTAINQRQKSLCHLSSFGQNYGIRFWFIVGVDVLVGKIPLQWRPSTGTKEESTETTNSQAVSIRVLGRTLLTFSSPGCDEVSFRCISFSKAFRRLVSVSSICPNLFCQ